MASIDPDVQVLLDALEARVAALEAAAPPAPLHPVRVIEEYEGGITLVYEKAPT